MITILAVLSLVVSAGLFYLGIQARTSGVPIYESHYVINNKLFGESADLREFITPYVYAIQEKAKELRGTNNLETITKTYNWLEEKYTYAEDDLVVLNNGQIVVRGGIDTWNLPIFALAVKNQNAGFIGDCEDGTFLLVSLLRANGIEACANIGTVAVQGNIYGHAWATVLVDGKEYLLETTLGEPLKELRGVPSFYKMIAKFNEKEIFVVTGADINKEIYPPLPPRAIRDLKNALEASK